MASGIDGWQNGADEMAALEREQNNLVEGSDGLVGQPDDDNVPDSREASQTKDFEHHLVTDGSVRQSSEGRIPDSDSHEEPAKQESMGDGVYDGSIPQSNNSKVSASHEEREHSRDDEEIMQDEPLAVYSTENGPQESSEITIDQGSTHDGTSIKETTRVSDSAQQNSLGNVPAVKIKPPNENETPGENDQDEHENEQGSSILDSKSTALLVENEETSQYRRTKGTSLGSISRETITGNDTSPLTAPDESLPAIITLEPITPEKKSLSWDRIVLFLWSICCVALIMLTANIAQHINWNTRSLITAIPIFNHPQGVFQYFATPLTLSQAKGIDFFVSAVLAPLIIAYANYIWFRTSRRLSSPNTQKLGDPNTNHNSPTEIFDAGTYDLGRLIGILKTWSFRNILFVVLLLSSALASTLLCNVLAYKALPGSENSSGDKDATYYHMVYIPALLFFALCSVTIASIVALLLVVEAREVVEEKKMRLAAASVGVSVEEYNVMSEDQQATARREFTVSFPTLPRFPLPVWRQRGQDQIPVNGNAGELEPLLPVSNPLLSEVQDFHTPQIPSRFKYWRISFPDFWKHRSEAAASGEDENEPLMTPESSRTSRQTLVSDTTITLPRTVQKTAQYNSARNFAFPSSTWFRNPLLDWGQGSQRADSNASHGTRAPEMSEPNVESSPSLTHTIIKNPTATELSPLLQADMKKQQKRTHMPWKFPNFQMPHFILPFGASNTDDLESQVPIPKINKGKKIEQNIPGDHTNVSKAKHHHHTHNWRSKNSMEDPNNKGMLRKTSNPEDTIKDAALPERLPVAAWTERRKQNEWGWSHAGWGEPSLITNAVSEVGVDGAQSANRHTRNSSAAIKRDHGSDSRGEGVFWRWSSLKTDFRWRTNGRPPAWDFGEWGDME